MTKSLMKKCPKCELPKNRANFSSNGYCKPCDALYHASRRATEKRRCRQCRESKSPSEYLFTTSRSCAECVQATQERKKLKLKTVYLDNRNAGDESIRTMMQDWLVRRWI